MKRITDYNIKYAPDEDIINILKTNHLIIIKGVNAQDKILNLLFNLKTDALGLVNGKCFDIEQEEDILKELNMEKVLFRQTTPFLVLSHGGKLIFKLKDDVAISVIIKAEDGWPVYHVRTYSPNEKEILFDKESDDDINLNIHEFKPKFTSISDVNQALKGKKINLDRTMARVSMPDFYAGPTVEVEGDGIYIHTVYARKGYVASEIYEYEIYDDDFVTVGIQSGLGDYDLRLSPQCYTGDEAGDYGIEVDDDGTVYLCENTGGMFGGVRRIRDLSEPLNAFVAEILMNTLVFEDSLLDESVMYCPDCGESYDNDEELCPDCGTKLVTEFEITMLEYKGLL
ncbi:MAG: zinc ribbon domain-containing protein [Methanobrevibacter sp.]|nr:zinc ribbon domain-containing protein [Methanobrevibacter sp.]